MRRIFKIVNKVFWKLGFSLSRLTNEKEVKELISRLRPIKTKYELFRIGGNADGGYLLPKDLEGIAACFSPGVAETASFESALAELGIKSFLADYSVESAPENDPPFHFTKKYVGVVNDSIHIKLETWVDGLAPNDSDLILQMDIEGKEFLTLLNLSDKCLNKFRIMVIEFHVLNKLFDINFFPIVKSLMDRILEKFNVVHLHPNNASPKFNFKGIDIPDTLEITFLRKDRSESFGYVEKLPNKSDARNVGNRTDIFLSDLWVGNTPTK